MQYPRRIGEVSRFVMTHAIKYMPETIADISALKRTDVRSYEKTLKLIEELHEHPRTGTGKPELLKH